METLKLESDLFLASNYLMKISVLKALKIPHLLILILLICHFKDASHQISESLIYIEWPFEIIKIWLIILLLMIWIFPKQEFIQKYSLPNIVNSTIYILIKLLVKLWEHHIFIEGHIRRKHSEHIWMESVIKVGRLCRFHHLLHLIILVLKIH